jgi:hypothetical protein
VRYRLITRIPYFNYTREFESFDALFHYMQNCLGEEPKRPNPCGTFAYIPRGEYRIEEVSQ